MGGILIGIAAWWIGGIALRPLAMRRTIDRPVLQVFLGIPVVGAVALFVGAFSLGAATLAISVLAVLGLMPGLRHVLGSERARHFKMRSPSRAEWVGIVFGVPALIFTVISMMAPVTGWDATVAHLALPQDYAQQGYIAVDPGNVYSAYPQLVHALYAVSFKLGGYGTLHFLFLGGAVASILLLGHAIASRLAGVLAAVILLTSPVFIDQGAAPGVDIPFLAFTLLALLCVWRWRQTAEPSWVLAAGMLAGSSCGIRHTGLIVCVILILGILTMSRRDRIPATLFMIVITGLAAAPWLIRTAIVTGNPVFPFLMDWFPESFVPHMAVSGLGIHESTQSFSWLEFLRFPWDIVMRPGDYDGWSKSPGGLVLILGVPGLLLGGRAVRGLAGFSVLGGVGFYFFQRLARYLLPFLGPMMVVAAVLPGRSRRLRLLSLGVIFVFATLGLGLYAAGLSFKLPVLLGRQSVDEYLSARVERYEAFTYANQAFKRGGKVLALDQRTYYLTPPSYQNYWGLTEIANLALAGQVAWLRAQGIVYVMLPVDYVRETGVLRDQLSPMIFNWRKHPEYFTLLHSIDTPRRDGSGMETTEFYEIIPPNDGAR